MSGPTQYLHELKNFSTLMAFVAGLNNAAITRLKHTRAEIPSKLTKVKQVAVTLPSMFDRSRSRYCARPMPLPAPADPRPLTRAR